MLLIAGPSLDVNIYQAYSRCDLYPDGTRKAVLIHAFNGKDFLSYDIDRKTVVASVPQAVIYKRQREEDLADTRMFFLLTVKLLLTQDFNF